MTPSNQADSRSSSPNFGLSLIDAARAAGLDVPEPAEPLDRTVRAGGIELHYLDWGNGHLPPLLFLHGFAQQSHSWDFASLMFRDRFHIISLDLRGHGDSEWAEDGSYLLSDYVSDVALVVESLGLENLTICGLSLGGRVAFVYAAGHPAVVRALVLVDSAPDLNLAGASRVRDFVQGPDVWDTFDDLVEYVAKYTRKLRPIEQIRGSVLRSARQLPDGRWTWKYDRVLRTTRQRDPMSASDRLWEQMRLVACPLLLVRGAKSDVLLPEAARKVIDTVPGSELAVVENAAHLVPGDNPAGFAAAVNPFLDRLLTGQ